MVEGLADVPAQVVHVACRSHRLLLPVLAQLVPTLAVERRGVVNADKGVITRVKV